MYCISFHLQHALWITFVYEFRFTFRNEYVNLYNYNLVIKKNVRNDDKNNTKFDDKIHIVNKINAKNKYKNTSKM